MQTGENCSKCFLTTALARKPLLKFRQIGRSKRFDLGKFGIRLSAFASPKQTLDVKHVCGRNGSIDEKRIRL